LWVLAHWRFLEAQRISRKIINKDILTWAIAQGLRKVEKEVRIPTI
jgi:hypothetical protein